MPIEIVVIRGEGDKDGGVIQDPLLSDTQVALARGFAELEDNADYEEVTIEMVINTAIEVGMIVSVLDSSYGATYYARVDSVSHAQSRGMPVTRVTLRRKPWRN